MRINLIVSFLLFRSIYSLSDSDSERGSLTEPAPSTEPVNVEHISKNDLESAQQLVPTNTLPAMDAETKSTIRRRTDAPSSENTDTRYVALAKNPDNEDEKNATGKFIEGLVVPTSVINYYKDADRKILGWGALHLNEEALEKVNTHPGVKEVYKDQISKSCLAFRSPTRPLHHAERKVSGPLNTRRSKAKRAGNWYKQELAVWNLKAISTSP
jgi:hypothetical protein